MRLRGGSESLGHSREVLDEWMTMSRDRVLPGVAWTAIVAP